MKAAIAANQEGYALRHMQRISKGGPVRGNAFHEFICSFAVAVNALLGLMGGSAPFFQYIEEKCDIPRPNPSN